MFVNIIKSYFQKTKLKYFKDDDYMRYSTRLGIEYSIEARKQCEELGIKYFDTSKNFLQVRKEIIKYIEEKL